MIRQISLPQADSPSTLMRRGIVLIVVMVVVVMISLAGFGFVAAMSNANKVVHLRGEQLQMENAVASAEEFLKQYLIRPVSPDSEMQGGRREEELMRGVVVSSEGPHGRVRFTVISPQPDDTSEHKWHYGLVRESGRLDLHKVMEWESRQVGLGRKALMALSGMTESIADAILDWMDADSTPRSTGAEDDYYSTLNPPYSARNGIPDSLEELLLVKGVTRSLLFGSDINQNHRVDPEEQLSLTSVDSRDSAGDEDVPWAEMLTLYSVERNRTRQGEPRIHLNQPDLQALHRELVTAFDPDLATFVVLYRQFGPSPASGSTTDVKSVKLDFARPPVYPFPSPISLLQAKVTVPAAMGAPLLVASPVPLEREPLDAFLENYLDKVTTTNASIFRGRININLATADVLGAIPGFDQALADQIIAARTSSSKQKNSRREHPCWPLTEGLVSLEKMKQIYPLITTGGDVYRTQIVAFSEASRLSQRVEIVLDASHRPVRRLFWKDLQVLGRGYPWDVLDTPGGISSTGTGAFDATPVGN